MLASICVTMFVGCAADVLTIPEHRPLMRTEPASLVAHEEEAAPVTTSDKAGKIVGGDRGNGKGIARTVTPQKINLAKDGKKVMLLKDDKKDVAKTVTPQKVSLVKDDKKLIMLKNDKSNGKKDLKTSTAAKKVPPAPTKDSQHATGSSKSSSASSSSSSSPKSAPATATQAKTAAANKNSKPAADAAKPSAKATAKSGEGNKMSSGADHKQTQTQAPMVSKQQGVKAKQAMDKQTMEQSVVPGTASGNSKKDAKQQRLTAETKKPMATTMKDTVKNEKVNPAPPETPSAEPKYKPDPDEGLAVR